MRRRPARRRLPRCHPSCSSSPPPPSCHRDWAARRDVSPEALHVASCSVSPCLLPGRFVARVWARYLCQALPSGQYGGRSGWKTDSSACAKLDSRRQGITFSLVARFGAAASTAPILARAALNTSSFASCSSSTSSVHSTLSVRTSYHRPRGLRGYGSMSRRACRSIIACGIAADRACILKRVYLNR